MVECIELGASAARANPGSLFGKIGYDPLDRVADANSISLCCAHCPLSDPTENDRVFFTVEKIDHERALCVLLDIIVDHPIARAITLVIDNICSSSVRHAVKLFLGKSDRHDDEVGFSARGFGDALGCEISLERVS